ncbi:hypothetical protein OAM87_04320 [Flavobacteriaceae bacterium]|nr:hypothetical protein [Flavobacteriaceae bacterium]
MKKLKVVCKVNGGCDIKFFLAANSGLRVQQVSQPFLEKWDIEVRKFM